MSASGLKQEANLTTPMIKNEKGQGAYLSQHPDYDDDISPPKNIKIKTEHDSQNLIPGLGKRLQRSFTDQKDPDLSSVYDPSSAQDEDMLTPFDGGDKISSIIGGNDAKPFRNVIKRYWTEEEVRNSFTFYVDIFRTRNLGCLLTNMGYASYSISMRARGIHVSSFIGKELEENCILL